MATGNGRSWQGKNPEIAKNHQKNTDISLFVLIFSLSLSVLSTFY